MALQFFNIKGWLNVACTLLRTHYIGFSLFELDNWCVVVDVVNLRMFLASLVYKEQFYI